MTSWLNKATCAQKMSSSLERALWSSLLFVVGLSFAQTPIGDGCPLMFSLFSATCRCRVIREIWATITRLTFMVPTCAIQNSSHKLLVAIYVGLDKKFVCWQRKKKMVQKNPNKLSGQPNI